MKILENYQALLISLLKGPILCALVMLVFLKGAVGQQRISPLTAAPTPSPESSSPEGEEESWYRIGLGDVIDIQVFNRPQLSVTVRVNEQGMVGLPLLGDVPAVCRTERQLAKEIEALYTQRRFLKTPQVNVFIKDYQASSVAVIGAVNAAGRFQLQRRVRLLELLLFAGGPSAVAGPTVHILHTAEVSRCELPGDEATAEGIEKNMVSYKLSDTLRSLESANPFIRAGDIVNIPENGTALILGNVVRPGPVAVTEQTTLLQAIALSGGPLPNSRDEVTIRRLAGGSTLRNEIVANLGAIKKRRAEDLLLQNGDIVEVSTASGFGSVMKGLMRSIVPTMGTLPIRVIRPY